MTPTRYDYCERGSWLDDFRKGKLCVYNTHLHKGKCFFFFARGKKIVFRILLLVGREGGSGLRFLFSQGQEFGAWGRRSRAPAPDLSGCAGGCAGSSSARGPPKDAA